MKLKYETGIATLIQFIVVSLLNIATGVSSTVTACRADSSECFGDIALSFIYFILLTGWFAFIWLLGYTAQERRSKRLAQALIAAEALIALVAAFNAKHRPDFVSLLASLADLVLALWIIILAFRLMVSGGKRITSTRSRRRPS